MLRINKSAFDGKWVNYAEGVSFLLVPFDSMKVSMDNNNNYKVAVFNLVKDSIKDWKGIVDENDTLLEVNEENIRYLIEYYPEITEFLDKQLFEIHESVISEIKN